MTEEAGIWHDGVAVYIRTVKENKFEVEFTESAMDWLTDPRMALVSENLYLPIGEMNQQYLVTKLNEFVGAYVEKHL
jgi:hypothetical protein